MQAMVWILLAGGLGTLQEWDQFRGPGGGGVAGDEAALPVVLDAEGARLWRTPVPPGHSSPCLSEGRVFVTGHGDGSVTTLALDRASGEILWRRDIEVETFERTHDVNGPASSSPVTDGERVFALFGSVGLVAYDLEGKELWRRELEPVRNTFGSASSPILAGGHLILLRDAREGSFLEALDPADGSLRWRVDRSSFGSGWSTPAVWRRGEVDELLVYGVGWLTAYDAADGSQRWAVPGLTDEPIVMPATGEGLVVVTSYNMASNPEVIGLPAFAELLERHDHDRSGGLDADEARENASVLSRHDADGEGDHPLSIFFRFLDEDEDGEIEAEEWPKLVAWLNAFEHANGILAIRPGTADAPPEVVWQYPRGVPECPSPLVVDGRVYLVKNGGMATCLDAATGELKYAERLGARGPVYASPVAGDGKIYAASARGEVTVYALGDELEVLARNDLGERILATPALSRGVVYLRTEEALHAFGVRD